MNEPSKYAAFLAPELSKSRLDAQWARIAERRPNARRRPHAATLPAVGLLVAACALGVVAWPRDSQSSSDSVWEGSVWEGSVVASDDAPVDMTLAEGTRIQVEPRSEVKLLHSSSQAVQVRLSHGSAHFEVAKRRTRRFSVNVGKIEVVVTGTQFRVRRKSLAHGERVQVEVEEGSVEIHRGEDGMVTLQAGEQWSTVVSRESPQDAPAEPHGQAAPEAADREREPLPESDDLADGAEAVLAEAEEAASGEAALGDSEAVADAESDDEVTAHASARSDRERARERRRRRARAATASAEELLDHANLARRAGRLGDAAELYAELVAHHPRDRRASLAAFELGRLRMDSLRDNAGAVQALERALKLDGRGAFAEDALARLVLAQEARGDSAACQRARSRYLARYPEGVHAQHVAERCGSN